MRVVKATETHIHLELSEQPVASTKERGPILVDLDADGRATCIELLAADTTTARELVAVFEEFGVGVPGVPEPGISLQRS